MRDNTASQKIRTLLQKKKLPYILFVGYTLLVLYWMFFGFGRTAGSADEPYRYNWIPFQTVMDFAFMRIGDRWDQLVNLLGNIGVFIPFGILLPWIRRLRIFQLMIWFGISIFFVEVLQMLTRRGTFDVDDIILNTFGVCIGYFIWRLIQRRFVSI